MRSGAPPPAWVPHPAGGGRCAPSVSASTPRAVPPPPGGGSSQGVRRRAAVRRRCGAGRPPSRRWPPHAGTSATGTGLRPSVCPSSRWAIAPSRANLRRRAREAGSWEVGKIALEPPGRPPPPPQRGPVVARRAPKVAPSVGTHGPSSGPGDSTGIPGRRRDAQRAQARARGRRRNSGERRNAHLLHPRVLKRAPARVESDGGANAHLSI